MRIEDRGESFARLRRAMNSLNPRSSILDPEPGPRSSILGGLLKLLLCFALLAGLIVGAAEIVKSAPAAPEWAAWLVGGTAALAALWVVAGLCGEDEET